MKSTFLKVMAIISLIFGIIGVAGLGMTFAGLGTLAMLGIPYPAIGTVGLVVGIIEAILMIVAGAIGIGASKDPAKAGKAVTWGIILIVLAVISLILAIVTNNMLQAQIDEFLGSFGAESVSVGGISWTNFTGLIIPILYFVAAFLFKKKANSGYGY